MRILMESPFMASLLMASGQAAIIAVVVWIITMALRRFLTAGARLALWSLVLLRLIVPAPESRLSAYNLFHNEATTEPMSPANGRIRYEPISRSLIQKATPESPKISIYKLPGLEWNPLLLLWIAGTAFSITLALAAEWRFRKRIRHSPLMVDERVQAVMTECRAMLRIRRRLIIRETELILSPALISVLRPTLLMPTGLASTLSRQELRFIILHELAHMTRHDLVIDRLLGCLSCVHWFNPLIRFACVQLRAEREILRDAMVLRWLRDEDRADYGHTLLKLAGGSSAALPAFSLGIVEPRRQLRQRIEAIANRRHHSAAGFLMPIALVVLLAGSLLTAREKPTAAGAADQEKPQIVRKTYDISDILRPINETQIIATTNSVIGPRRQTTSPAEYRQQQIDAIFNVIRDTVDPDTWISTGGSIGDLRLEDNSLIITQTEDAQRQIAGLLAKLRQGRSVNIQMKCKIIRIPDGVNLHLDDALPEPGKVAGEFLDDARAKQLMDHISAAHSTSVISAPTVLIFNGQRASIMVGSTMSYIADVGADNNAVMSVKTGTLDTGFAADLQATVSADRKYITVTMKPKLVELLELKKIKAFSNPSAFAQKPVTANWESDTTVSAPDGATILLALSGPKILPAGETASAGFKGARVLFLIKSHIIMVGKN
jgi:beta-lactamase regulating signal transducer with metallopeptidase domain